MRPFTLALLLLALAALPAAAQPSAYPYSPPTAPPAPDLLAAALRLLGLTALTLAICGGVVWWAKRATRRRVLAADTAGRLVLEARLPLDARNAVILLRVDGHPVVVTTDASGLKAIIPMQPTFDAALDAAAEPDPTPPAATAEPAE